MHRHPIRSTMLRYFLVSIGMLLACSAWADDDPPSRVARLAYLSGDVTFAPSGDDQWDQASINRPLTTGDRLLTNGNSRAAMDTDGGDLRIGSNTGFNILSLDDQGTQIELSRGTLNWRIDRTNDGQNNEVDTPTIAFVATQPGTYKIEVAEDGSSTTISILQGGGTVYGEGGASYQIGGRQAWRFGDSSLKDITGMPLALADDFDRWCGDRDASALTVVSNDYVSPDMVGVNDLADNGSWQTEADYGAVWYPTTVAVGWAPYRYGRWAWVAPWGWTWIDDAPWGFAPFHYGRWIYASNRWGWVPGPRHVRPVYCPAMVAFVGGSGWSVSASSGRPVGWVPLGPRDVYVPWYRGSQRYVTNVNVTNVRNISNVQITNVYNDYRGNRRGNIQYMNQSAPGGTTVVTRDAFSSGRRVNGAQVNIDRSKLDSASAIHWHDLPAGRPRVGLQAAGSSRAPSQEFARPPVLHASPAQPATGPRGPNSNDRPAWNAGRDSQTNRFDDGRDPRRNGSATNNGTTTQIPIQRDPANRRDNTSNGSVQTPQQPQQPSGRDNSPRWNNNGRGNDTPQNGAMPSSRFTPRQNRNSPGAVTPSQDNSSSSQQQPQGRGSDPRWNNNPRGNDRRNGGDDTATRVSPVQQEQPQQPVQRTTPPPVFQHRDPPENRPEPQNIPQPEPRQPPQVQVQPAAPQVQQRNDGQRNAPVRQPQENRVQIQRPEQHQQRPAPRELPPRPGPQR